MSNQVWLPGMELQSLCSFFFALKPDEAAREQAEAIAREVRRDIGPNDEPFDRSRYHISLFPLGVFEGWPRDKLCAALEAGEAVKGMPFELRLDRLESFGQGGDRRPLVLRNSEPAPPLNAFLASLGDAMRRHRVGRYVRAKIAAHLTLYYRCRKLAARHVPPVVLRASRFVLIQSHIGEGRHTEIESWLITP
jgi:2'-5' RNA ligase